MKIALDGSARGAYRGDCECGTTWNGQAEVDGSRIPSPALPVAETVVHMKMCHDNTNLELVFTWRFEQWLKVYWDRSSNPAGLSNARMTR